MSAQSDEAMRLLRECHAMLTLIAKRTPPVFTPAQPFAGRDVAPASDLDSQYGDEVIKFDPRNWSGESCKGKRMSECSIEFLDMLADVYAYFAQKNDDDGAKTDAGKPKSMYDRRSERRARGWAARLRAGWKAPASAGDLAPEEMPKW